jgi:subtilisin family serine protease
MIYLLQFILATTFAQSFDFELISHKARMNYLGVNEIKDQLVGHRKLNGTGVVVAVIDSGVDISHEDLKNKIHVNHFEIANNFIDDDKNGFVDDVYGWNFYENTPFVYDDNGHGTHVAGIIAGEKYGVADKAKILPIKITGEKGEISTIHIIQAIEYAVKRGARVINLSLSGIGRLYFEKYQEEKMIRLAREHNAIIVAAAGNESLNNTLYSVFPANHISDNMLSVCATDNYGQLADFSNFSALYIHLCAPGVDIYSTVPRQFNKKYDYMSGTSMAAPIVSGIVALLYSGNRVMPAYMIRNALIENTRTYTNLKDKSLSGGVVNAAKAAKVLYNLK